MNEAPDGRAAARRIDKLTFDYSVAEDRLLARLQAMNGERSAVWLTQRLARRLVMALLSHLDKTAAAAGPATDRQSDRPVVTSDPQQREMVNSFRHQAAMLKHAPLAPVAEVDTAGAPVLKTIRARMSKNRMLLNFDLASGPGVLILTQDTAWQMLHILLNAFRRAEWPLDIWPDWMRDGRSGVQDSQAGKAQPLH